MTAGRTLPLLIAGIAVALFLTLTTGAATKDGEPVAKVTLKYRVVVLEARVKKLQKQVVVLERKQRDADKRFTAFQLLVCNNLPIC